MDPQNPEFSVADFETPAQRVIRESFAALTTQNQLTIQNFDPGSQFAESSIELSIDFQGEAERQEPQLTAQYQATMLKALGLHQPLIEPADSRFSQVYADDVVVQIRDFERPDGSRVPLYIQAHADEQSAEYHVTELKLLSFQRADEDVATHEHDLEVQAVDHRLKKDFDFTDDFLDKTDLSFEDKQAMLASFDEFQQLEIALPDLSQLNTIRRKLARAVMPGTEIAAELRRKQLSKTVRAYQDELHQLVNTYADGDTKIAQDILKSEQLLRLANLNKQLQVRKSLAAAAAASITLFLTSFGAGSGFAAGYILNAEGHHDSYPIIGAMVAGLSGTSIGLEQVRKLHRDGKHIKTIGGFSQRSGLTAEAQIQDEIKLAKAYYTLTTRY